MTPSGDVRISQEDLELVESPATPQVRISQEALEVGEYPTTAPIVLTQEALEVNKFPTDTKVWMTQECLEVLLRAGPIGPPPSRNKIIPQYIKRHNLIAH